ncbi:unnamed protein product [Paramecium sonneborni]|uniref:EF-hand domain-containing protein n=1 Tax=Paramecium sonneborni TaxID=65129 RepID=A0A8S1PQB3_9CILI|nr:unnamed protein product [Paramecium sonneborni]
MNSKEQNYIHINYGKVYPNDSGDNRLLNYQDDQIPKEEIEPIQYGKIGNGDQKIKTRLVGKKDYLNKWMIEIKQHQEAKKTSTFILENNIQSQYLGMILLRRLTRFILQLILIGIGIILFVWGDSVTVKNTSWQAEKDTGLIDIYVGNCFLNVSQSNDLLKFFVKAKGSVIQQINGANQFIIKAEILESGVANLTFYNPTNDLRKCIVDLQLPVNIDEFKFICRYQSECILAFGLQNFKVTQKFNASSESQAKMQINIRNIETENFIYNSSSSGNLFVNNFLISKADIRLNQGDIFLQSTKPYSLNFSSQSQSICATSQKIIQENINDCNLTKNEQGNVDKECTGFLSLCSANSCDIKQTINIIANSSKIYANTLSEIGKPLIQNIYEVEVFKTSPFDSGQLNFDQESLFKIQNFVNKSGSENIAIRLDVGGHYLLQHSLSTFWTYFSNPSYAAFQPWWLSAFSGTFLNPSFEHMYVRLESGFCPQNVAMNAEQILEISDLIKRTFNTTYGKAILIQKDNDMMEDDVLNLNINYYGFNPLEQKQKGQFEKWSTIENIADNIIFQPLEYDPFFIAAITLSLFSSLIFGVFQAFTLESCTQISNYNETAQQKKSNLTETIKQMIKKLNQIGSQKDPPILLGVLSYIFYFLCQSQLKSAPKLFFNTLFTKSKIKIKNFEFIFQTFIIKINYYDDSIDEEEINEQYEQFCYLNKLTIEPLSQQIELLKQYGYEFVEKQDVLILSKIKMNPNPKSLDSISYEEKTSKNSIELFISTQCLLTGIPADVIRSDKLEKAYVDFCGKTLTILEFNAKVISDNYNLSISDLKAFELNQVIVPNSQRYSRVFRLLRKFAKFIPLIDDNYFGQSIFKIKKDSKINQCQQNPIESLRKIVNQDLNYNMFIQSLIFNYHERFWNRNYKYQGSNSGLILSDLFEVLYIEDWVLSDLFIIFCNLLVTMLTIIPMLFFIVLVNASYSPFSIYNPNTLLFMDDVLYRPWLIIGYFGNADDWVLALGILLTYYAIISFIFQSVKYLSSQFPEEVGFIQEFKLYQNNVLKYFNLFQWLQFLLLAFSSFIYFGLIIVWLLLGAIINPNLYLVYSSSALSLVAFIAVQISSIKSIYEQVCGEIKKIVNEIFLRTFGNFAGSLIKEIQIVSDLSITIINSKNMNEAKQAAKNLGFQEELNELCILTQGMLDYAYSADLNQDQINFKQIKEKFLQKAQEKFINISKDQFEIPQIVAELLVKVHFSNFDQIINPLANQIQIESQNKIPASIIKWVYQTSVKLNNLLTTNKDQEKYELLNHWQTISEALVDFMTQKIKNEDKQGIQLIYQILLKIIFNLLMNSSSQSTYLQIKYLFENLKDFITISPTPLKVLELIFSYAQSLNDNNNTHKLKQELITKLLSLFNIDNDLGSVYKILFQKKQSLFIDKDIQLNATQQSEIIMRLCDKYFLKDNKDQILKMKFETFVIFIMKLLQNDKPPLAVLVKLFQLINSEKNDNNQEYFEKLLDQYQEQLYLGFSSFQLGIKDWYQVMNINLQDKSREILFDILYVSSRFLWSSKILERQNFKKQSPEYENVIQRKKNIQASETLSRKDKLKDRGIIKLMSQAFQISENAVIGLILILKNDIQTTIYHDAIYNELFKIAQTQTFNTKVTIVNFIFQLLSKTNFEEILPFLKQVQNKLLINKLLKIIFSSQAMFKLFNGFMIIENIFNEYNRQMIDKEEIKIYLAMAKLQLFGQEFLFQMENDSEFRGTVEKIWNDRNLQIEINQQLDESEDQLVNYYKTENITFFTFLMQTQRDKKSKQFKLDFLQQLSKQVGLHLDYIFMILEQQQCILSNTTLSFPQLNGLNQEAFKNLLIFISFQDAISVQQSLQYFIKFNSFEYESIDISKIQIELQKIIDIEKNIISFQTQNKINYINQKLQNLVVNKIFQTRQPVNNSFLGHLFQHIKYELNDNLTICQVQRKKMEFAPTVSSQNSNDIKIFLAQIQLCEYFFQMMFNENAEIKKQAVRNVLKLDRRISSYKLRHISDFMADIIDGNYIRLLFHFLDICNGYFLNRTRYYKFFRKVIDIINGFKIKTKKYFDYMYLENGKLYDAFQQLKYTLSLNLDCFLMILQEEEVNCNVRYIKGLFSLMTSNLDYDILVNVFNFEEQTLKFAQFLVSAIFSENKLKLLQDPQNLDFIKTELQLQEVSPIISLVEVLETNSMDAESFIIKLRIQQNPSLSKLFKVLFAFKRQLVFKESLKELQLNFNSLQDQRFEIFKQGNENFRFQQNQQNDIELTKVLEILHWFSHPRPINFIFLLDRIQLLDQYEPAAIFTAAIVGIAKYDQYNQYQTQPPEYIKYRSDNIQKLSNKSVEKAVLFITQTSDQDVQEAFNLFQLATGINPLLVNAIFNDNQNSNRSLQQIFQSVNINNQKIILEFLQNFNTFHYDVITLIKIIEFEAVKNSKHPKFNNEIVNDLLNSLGLDINKFITIENFLKSQAKGKVSNYFPFSSLVLIFSLKQMRQIKQQKDNALAKYLKGQFCINIAFTVFEKYLYFYDNKNLINLNKPAMVKLISLGIFDTTNLRSSEYEIDYVKLEGLLYPGISDPLLEINGIKPNYICQKTNNLSDLSKNFNDQYDEYCKVFYRILPQNNEQIENRLEFEDYNKFWTSLFLNNFNYPQQISRIYFNSLSNESNQKNYFDEIIKKFPKELSKLQLQYSLIFNLIQLNLSQYGYIRSKYWDKSLQLIKRQIFKQSEIELLENEQIQQIMIQLMQYYIGQFTVSINERNNIENLQQQKQNFKETELKLIQAILCLKQQQSIKSKFRGSKQKFPVDLIQLIDNILGLTLHKSEQKAYRSLINLLYNPNDILDEQFNYKQWGNKNIIMNAKTRDHYKTSQQQLGRIPKCYLYYSLGNQDENLYQNDIQMYKQNSNLLSLGIDELLKDYKLISTFTRYQIKVMIRCFLGDVEAWYTFIALLRHQENLETDLLSESLIRTFILEILLFFKNCGFRNALINKDQIEKQSLQQILKLHTKQNLSEIIEYALINTFIKHQLVPPEKSICQIIEFISLLFEGKTEVLYSENSLSLEILIKLFNIDLQEDQELISLIKLIIELLFKGDQLNSNIQQFVSQIKFLQDEKYKGALELFQDIIEIKKAENVNVFIVKSYQILERLNLVNFYKYSNLFVSFSLIIHIPYFPINEIDEITIMNVLLYPIIWLGSTLENPKEPFTKFSEFSKTFMQNITPKHFKQILSILCDLNNQEINIQSDLSKKKVNFYLKSFKAWCLQNQESDLLQMLQFIRDKVFDISQFPASLQIIIQALIEQLYDNENNESPFQTLSKKFIVEITKNETLKYDKQVIEAIFFTLQDIQNSEDILSEKFILTISNLLSNYPEIKKIVEIIVSFYQTKKIDTLKFLSHSILQQCFENKQLEGLKLENIPFEQLHQMALNVQKMIKYIDESKEVNEKEFLTAIKSVLEPIFGEKQKINLQILIKCSESIFALKKKQFNKISQEFFQIMKISLSNSQFFIRLMQDFEISLQTPQQLIEEKMASLADPDTMRTIQYMSSVMLKLNDNQELKYEDMFRILDKNSQRQVQANDVIQFLRRVNIEITEHKFREVLVIIKGQQVNMKNCMIDFYEFKEIMQEISIQTINCYCIYPYWSQSIAIPGTFAAIINAILPMIGGLGLNKYSAEKKLKSVQLTYIIEVVKKAIKVIQARKI